MAAASAGGALALRRGIDSCGRQCGKRRSAARGENGIWRWQAAAGGANGISGVASKRRRHGRGAAAAGAWHRMAAKSAKKSGNPSSAKLKHHMAAVGRNRGNQAMRHRETPLAK